MHIPPNYLGTWQSQGCQQIGTLGPRPHETRDVWQEVRCADGRMYFHNTVTGETTWFRPASLISRDAHVNYQYPHHQGQRMNVPQGYSNMPMQQQQQQQLYGAYGTLNYSRNHALGSQPHATTISPAGTASYNNAAYQSEMPLSVSSPKHTFSHQQRYTLTEKVMSLSGDSFKCMDDTGILRYNIKGSALSLREKKRMFCAVSGTELLRLKASVISMRGRQVITDPSGKAVLTIRKKSFVPGFGNSTVLGFHGDDDNAEPILTAKGDWFKKDFVIKDYCSHRVMATVKRKMFNASNIIFNSDTYQVVCEPHVDCALMIMFTVVLDEIYNDQGML